MVVSSQVTYAGRRELVDHEAVVPSECEKKWIEESQVRDSRIEKRTKS